MQICAQCMGAVASLDTEVQITAPPTLSPSRWDCGKHLHRAIENSPSLCEMNLFPIITETARSHLVTQLILLASLPLVLTEILNLCPCYSTVNGAKCDEMQLGWGVRREWFLHIQKQVYHHHPVQNLRDLHTKMAGGGSRPRWQGPSQFSSMIPTQRGLTSWEQWGWLLRSTWWTTASARCWPRCISGLIQQSWSYVLI